jgi:hypothetical protein
MRHERPRTVLIVDDVAICACIAPRLLKARATERGSPPMPRVLDLLGRRPVGLLLTDF